MKTAQYDCGWQHKWYDMKQYGPFSRHIRRIIKNMVRHLDFIKVLDVGCGQGSLLRDFISEFPQIEPYGIDISPTAIRLAQERLPQGCFWVYDITRGQLQQSFDLVICSEVLEHIEDDLAVLRTLRAITGQYLIISTPQGRMRQFERQVGHVRNYARGELIQKLRASGFKITKVVEWGFPFYSPIYRNILEIIDAKGTGGHFGLTRRAISEVIYYLFLCNSSRKGDEIFVLAEPA